MKTSSINHSLFKKHIPYIKLIKLWNKSKSLILNMSEDRDNKKVEIIKINSMPHLQTICSLFKIIIIGLRAQNRKITFLIMSEKNSTLNTEEKIIPPQHWGFFVIVLLVGVFFKLWIKNCTALFLSELHSNWRTNNHFSRWQKLCYFQHHQ